MRGSVQDTKGVYSRIKRQIDEHRCIWASFMVGRALRGGEEVD